MTGVSGQSARFKQYYLPPIWSYGNEANRAGKEVFKPGHIVASSPRQLFEIPDSTY